MGIKITDTTLRDAHQSLIATRLRTADVIPIAPDLDKIGFNSLECWGGATFDACLRFLNEDPWERLQTFKKHIRHTPLQMLLRGQNLVGYRHYADDVVEEFVRLAVKNGISIFRIFDALNDVRNMITAIRAAQKYKAHVQGTICYTVSPAHTIEKFVQMGKELEDLGCDSICIKDMAGLITPQAAFNLVKALKKSLKIPINLHSHCTSGVAPLSYLAAAQAGVDILDTALGPFSGGTSQPPTESIVAAFQGTEFDTGLPLADIIKVSNYFSQIREKYQSLFDPIAQKPDVSVFLHQIPGGMISNLISQLKEQNKLEKYQEVLKEVPRVREELGFPPLVTPTSQIVGTQAVLNVIGKERYGIIAKETKAYCLGHYGRPPAPIDPQIKKKIIGKENTIEGRPADYIKPQLAELKKEAQQMGILQKEEDLLTYALYPNVAPKFLRGELKEEIFPSLEKEVTPTPKSVTSEFQVDVDGEIFNVRIYPVSGGVSAKEIAPVPAEKTSPKEQPGAILSPMPGMVLRLLVKLGERVEAGRPILVLEAMKMEMPVESPYTGEVKEIFVFESEMVEAGDLLMIVR
ncbi:MAG: sodium-extruding oxaloacetate decarboxylase subunit alpha [Thermodesulfobacteriota bacterium]